MVPRLMTWKPWTFFAVAIAGWMNRQQHDATAYLREENRILREKVGHKNEYENLYITHGLSRRSIRWVIAR